MRLKPFDFHDPSSLVEAVSLLGNFGEQGKALAGGTDLLVQMKNGRLAPSKIINLLNIPELQGIAEKDGFLRIGALANHDQLGKAPLLRGGWGILSEAARNVGSPQIRHRGTLGGNLCNASPSADTAPALLVLEAEVALTGLAGERRLPLEGFFLGPGSTALKADELLKEVHLPPVPENTIGTYLKLGRRKSLDLALVSVALLLTPTEDRAGCKRARVALGGVAPTPMRAKETEKFLEGVALDAFGIREAAKIASGECRPIGDIRASADYRREMVGVLIERAVRKCLSRAASPPGIEEKGAE